MTNGLLAKMQQSHQEQEAKAIVFSIKDWLTTTNHKQVGILYIVTAIFFMAVAGSFGEMMRTQLAVPDNNFLLPFTYDQTVTLHGLLMILWVLTPLGIGLANYIVPLQIGAKDLAFPRMNALSYWTYLFSGIMLVGSVFMPGGGPNTGWTLYAPLNTIQFTSQAGMTLTVMALMLFSLSVTMGSINFLTTIVRNRAKGVTWKRLPIFTWSIVFTMTLALFAFPPLAAGLLLLSSDRFLGTVFFSATQGGGILWDELFWFFGHPEVYIVVFPALGVIAEVFQTFAKRPVFSRTVFIVEFAAVTFLSVGVWMHHMFTTGVNYSVLQTFSFTTLAISIPFEGVVLGFSTYALQRSHKTEHSDAIQLSRHIHCNFRRHNWRLASISSFRLRFQRDLLDCRSFPLRHGWNHSFRANCRSLLLVAENNQENAQ